MFFQYFQELLPQTGEENGLFFAVGVDMDLSDPHSYGLILSDKASSNRMVPMELFQCVF